jgi:predicted esterase
MIEHFTHEVMKTAHIYTFGFLTKKTRFVWIACHGYGQSADRFISKFDQFDPVEHFIIAPEGLSRFYWKGVSDDVVASWMTSKDRLDEIEDYLSYLKKILERFESRFLSNTRFIFFGFSQGCATVMRFMTRFQLKFSHAMFWAGSLPKEINYLQLQNYLSQGKIHIIYGHEDPYLNPEIMMKEREFLASQNINTHEYVFEGRHRVDKQVLQQYFMKFLIN